MSILINKNNPGDDAGNHRQDGQFHTKMGKEYANGRNCYVAGVNRENRENPTKAFRSSPR